MRAGGGDIDFTRLAKYIVPLEQSHVDLEEDENEASLEDVSPVVPRPVQASEPVVKKQKNRDEPAPLVLVRERSDEHRKKGCVYFYNSTATQTSTNGEDSKLKKKPKAGQPKAPHVSNSSKLLLDFDKLVESSESSSSLASSSHRKEVTIELDSLLAQLRSVSTIDTSSGRVFLTK